MDYLSDILWTILVFFGYGTTNQQFRFNRNEIMLVCGSDQHEPTNQQTNIPIGMSLSSHPCWDCNVHTKNSYALITVHSWITMHVLGILFCHCIFILSTVFASLT